MLLNLHFQPKIGRKILFGPENNILMKTSAFVEKGEVVNCDPFAAGIFSFNNP